MPVSNAMTASEMEKLYLKNLLDMNIKVKCKIKISIMFAALKICVLLWTYVGLGNIKYWQEYNLSAEECPGYDEFKQHKTQCDK